MDEHAPESAAVPAAAPPYPAAELLRRWRDEGDSGALDDLLWQEVSVLKSRLRARIARSSQDPLSASDIAQDTVVRFLEVDTSPRFDDPRALRAYLWTAAWRLLLERVGERDRHALRIDRMESRQLLRGLSTTGGLSEIDERERGVALDLALQLLRPMDREILHLVYFEGFGIQGAARRLGIAHGAAKMRVVRARRELAKTLCRWDERIEAP